MSEEVTFQFAVLRYIHDPVTAEFLNEEAEAAEFSERFAQIIQKHEARRAAQE